MRLSAVSKTQPFAPTVGNQISSGVPRSKWLRWSWWGTSSFCRTAKMAAELHRFSSRYRAKVSGRDWEGALPADRFFDFLRRAAIFRGKSRDVLAGTKSRRDYS